MDLLDLTILSPKKVLFKDKVFAVSSINSKGKFDILAQHGNFITLVKNDPIVITKSDKKKVEFKFPLAIIYTANNSVKIYTEIQSQLATS